MNDVGFACIRLQDSFYCAAYNAHDIGGYLSRHVNGIIGSGDVRLLLR